MRHLSYIDEGKEIFKNKCITDQITSWHIFHPERMGNFFCSMYYIFIKRWGCGYLFAISTKIPP
jgi:hypothetical protein